ncbi:MAG TPA: DUF3347 domain-containing protein [Pedobacter sp.]|nr:DUF3347 domain-containing protein [Pedobacter sp.]
MKIICTTTLAIWLLSLTSYAGERTIAPLQELLSHYLSIKDALVNSDSKTAGIKAEAYGKTLEATTTAELNADAKKTLAGLRSILAKAADQIAKSKDIGKQRIAFAELSAGMLTLSKTVKLADKSIYEQFCPMKKASWLSNEQTIKNPYYGRQMLSCGTVKTTIQN